MVVIERRKSRPRLPVDDDENDGAQADEELLAGSRVRTGLMNVDTLIEDDEGCRHSMLM